MDDSDLRRGKPSLHKKFDEATALLAGNCLLTFAFEVMADSALSNASQSYGLKIISEAAKAIGAAGMMAGQMRDILFQAAGTPNIEEFFAMNREKTGKLIELCIKIPAIIKGVESRELTLYSEALGKLYQMTDDLLDYKEAPFYEEIYGSRENLLSLIAQSSAAAQAINSPELCAFAEFIKTRVK